MNDFTPDTEYVRRTFVSAQGPEERVGPGFDRWLQGVLADAWDAGSEEQYYMSEKLAGTRLNPYRKGAQ